MFIDRFRALKTLIWLVNWRSALARILHLAVFNLLPAAAALFFKIINQQIQLVAMKIASARNSVFSRR